MLSPALVRICDYKKSNLSTLFLLTVPPRAHTNLQPELNFLAADSFHSTACNEAVDVNAPVCLHETMALIVPGQYHHVHTMQCSLTRFLAKANCALHTGVSHATPMY